MIAPEAFRLKQYRRSRACARLRVLFLYLLQAVLCYMLLGPLLSFAIFSLLYSILPGASLPKPSFGLLPDFWQLFLDAPLGFLLSLLIGGHKRIFRASHKLPARGCLAQTGRPSRGRHPHPPFHSHTFRGRQRSVLFWMLFALAMGLPVILVSNLLAILLDYLLPELPSFQMDEIQKIFSHYSKIQVFLLIVVSPAILEELVYRGRGFTLLSRCWRGPWAAGFSSLIFAVVHSSPVEVISLLPLAAYLGWLRWRSGGLVPCILVHLQNNGLAFLWLLWTSGT